MTETVDRKAPQSNPIIRFREKPTRGRAIKAFCCQCMGCTDDSIEPGFRRYIAECDHRLCALWSFRPFQRGEPDEDDPTEALLQELSEHADREQKAIEDFETAIAWRPHPTAPGWMWNTSTNEVISDADYQGRCERGEA